MPNDHYTQLDWLTAAGAIASLAAISPPAAGAAAVALGLHQAQMWLSQSQRRDVGLDKAE